MGARINNHALTVVGGHRCRLPECCNDLCLGGFASFELLDLLLTDHHAV